MIVADPFLHLSYSMTRQVSLAPTEGTGLHKHPFYEAYIVLGGAGTLFQYEQAYTLNPGTLFIIDADAYHDIRAAAASELNVSYLRFYITQQENGTRVARQELVRQGDLVRFIENHAVLTENRGHLICLFEHVRALVNSSADYATDRFYHQASLLLIGQIITTSLPERDELPEGARYQHLRTRVLKLVDRLISQPVRVSDLALELGMSERTLRRKWSRFSHRSLSEEIIHRKIERACQLLLLPDISIAEVGRMVGVPEQSHFSRLFRQRKHCSPRDYRRLHIETAPAPDTDREPFATIYKED